MSLFLSGSSGGVFIRIHLRVQFGPKLIEHTCINSVFFFIFFLTSAPDTTHTETR